MMAFVRPWSCISRETSLIRRRRVLCPTPVPTGPGGRERRFGWAAFDDLEVMRKVRQTTVEIVSVNLVMRRVRARASPTA